jgi:arginase
MMLTPMFKKSAEKVLRNSNLNIIFANCCKGQPNKGVGNVVKNLNVTNSLFREMNKVSIPLQDFNNKKGYYKLRTEVYETHKRGDIPFTLGGDHSLAVGTVAGSLDFYKKDLTTIWIDAHADINTYASSHTKNLHGMPLSFLTGMDKSFMNMDGNELLTKNLLYYGLRDVDDFEQRVLDTNNIQHMTSKELNRGDNFGHLKIPTDKVHLSVDVDVLDPLYMSSTGTPVSNGISPEKLFNLINWIDNNSDVVAVDLVEYNPECSISGQQFNTDQYIMREILKELLNIFR